MEKNISNMTAEDINNIGLRYWNGNGVEQDYKKAAFYYQEAAKLGFPRAYYDLGICYSSGQGVKVNKEVAFRNFLKSAELGYGDGMYNSAICLHKGEGTKKDEGACIKWMKQAAELKQAEALNFLGNHSREDGKKMEAYDYYTRSSMYGFPLATINRIVYFIEYETRESALANLSKAIEQNSGGEYKKYVREDTINNVIHFIFHKTKPEELTFSTKELTTMTNQELAEMMRQRYIERFPLIDFSQVEIDVPRLKGKDIYNSGTGVFTMPFNNVLDYDFFDDLPYKEEITTFVINQRFGYDEDVGSHFKDLPSLERFDVIGPSKFSVSDGILYLDDCTDMDDTNIIFDFTEKPVGRILVAFPCNHPCKKFTVPSDVVAICNSAFANTKIEELTIPDSVEQIGFCAFLNMQHLKKIRVPNRLIKMRLDHYDTDPTSFELLSNKKGEILNEDVICFWNEVRNQQPRFDWSKYWFSIPFDDNGK